MDRKPDELCNELKEAVKDEYLKNSAEDPESVESISLLEQTGETDNKKKP